MLASARIAARQNRFRLDGFCRATNVRVPLMVLRQRFLALAHASVYSQHSIKLHKEKALKASARAPTLFAHAPPRTLLFLAAPARHRSRCLVLLCWHRAARLPSSTLGSCACGLFAAALRRILRSQRRRPLLNLAGRRWRIGKGGIVATVTREQQTGVGVTDAALCDAVE